MTMGLEAELGRASSIAVAEHEQAWILSLRAQRGSVNRLPDGWQGCPKIAIAHQPHGASPKGQAVPWP